MKLSKKILAAMSATALLATASFFTSCGKDDEDDAFSGKKVDFDNSYVTISDSNVVAHATKDTTGAEENTKYYYRAFNKLTTRHYGSTCTITLTPTTDGINYESEKRNGVNGFVFDMNDGTEDTYNFLIASVCYNPATQNVGTYISQFKNALIKNNNFSDKSSFTDKDGTQISTTENSNGAVEVEIINGNTTGSTQFGTSTAYYGFKASDFSVNDAGNIVVVIKVTQDSESGDYEVAYYKSADDAASTTVNPVAKFTVKDSYTIESGYNQEKMAMYANIYPGQHLVADFAFTDTVGNAIPFEDEVVEE